MLISYRDSARYPSDPLALQAWVRVAELVARQVVCSPRGFDPLQFARALELCRHLTCRTGNAAIKRMITACAAAGVAVVVVPTFARCHASSVSKWLVEGKRGRAMIALSIRYRRDDQLYFSLFREAGAILLSQKTEGREKTEVRFQKSEGRCSGASDSCLATSDFSDSLPDRFAREFLVPPEQEAELALLTAQADPAAAIRTFAEKLRIAPGLVVGRMQHDGMITWKQHNRLKREVDCTWALRGAEALEETWPNQAAAATMVMKDFNLEQDAARHRLARAVAGGTILTNGQARKKMRIEPGELSAWRLTMRDRDLDAAEAA